MDKEKLIKKLNDQLPLLKSRYMVKTIGIFGSVARGDCEQDSDIDIVVEFSTPIGFFEFVRLESFLSEVLGGKVDLVSKKGIKPVIRDSILKETIYV